MAWRSKTLHLSGHLLFHLLLVLLPEKQFRHPVAVGYSYTTISVYDAYGVQRWYEVVTKQPSIPATPTPAR